METLNKKIDFTLIFEVKNANPNGDPMNGNRPRTNFEELGEVSDVCLKRKIRNRLKQNKEKIFVQSQDDTDDSFDSLKSRFDDFIKVNNIEVKKLNADGFEKLKNMVRDEWIDVRTFGQVFAFEEKFNLSVRGAMSIQSAFSIEPVQIESMQITKSVNSKPADKKGSDTMGMKHRIDYGIYKTNGSINTHFAEKNGFTYDDALKIKDALTTIFENDMSSARPEGSMRVVGFAWWEHDNLNGTVPSHKLFDSIQIQRKEGINSPNKLSDYIVRVNEVENAPEMEKVIWEF